MNHFPTPSHAGASEAIRRFFGEDVKAFQQRMAELEREIDPAAVPQRGDRYHREVLQAFEQSQQACRQFEQAHHNDPELIAQVQKRFREETDRWFMQSWFGERARTKPNGFVGDFQMLINLYETAIPSRGIGGYLDVCLWDLPLAQAVRGRLSAAREFLLKEIAARQGTVRILDIASGPGREYQAWPAMDDGQQVEVLAMDSDPEALTYVEQQVAPDVAAGTNVRPVRYNALRTRSAKNTVKNFGSFDVIYSVGLCDYLSDEHLVAMLAAWRETLNEEGVLYIAFKDTEQYDKTPYQWHLDWFFFQRTLEDVLSLYRQAGFDTGAMETARDGTGIIINFISRSGESDQRQVRFDAAEQAAALPHAADAAATTAASRAAVNSERE